MGIAFAEKKVAFAGPWIGELGWEILTWVPYLRKLSREYDKMYISTFAGVEALYTGFHCELDFKPHDYTERIDDWTKRGGMPCPADTTDTIKSIKEYRIEGEYVRYGSPVVKDVGVLFHARGIEKGASKNWPQAKWEKLAKEFPGALTVGTASDLDIEEIYDARGRRLNELMDVIASAAVVIGGSSGVMHLALMCGTPIVTWGDCNNFGDTLKNRYMSTWNPFGTPVTWVGDTWDPEPEQIMEALKPKHSRPDTQTLSAIYDAIQSGHYLLSAAHIKQKDDQAAIVAKSVAINFPDDMVDEAAKQMASNMQDSIAKVRAERAPVSWR